jgi:hypothetical protein
LRDQIAETFDGEEVRVLIIEVDGHDGDIGGQVRIAKGGDDDVVLLDGLVAVGLDQVSKGKWAKRWEVCVRLR